MTWLYVPGLDSSRSAPEQAAPSLEFGLFGPEPSVWVTSSGKPSQRPLSWRGWLTRPWIKLLSGTISIPSTAARSATEWISSLPLIRAKSTVSPGSEQERAQSATCGPRCAASSENASQASSSGRTSPAASGTCTDESFQTYERWATGLRRDYSRRVKSGRLTGGSECSYWHGGGYPTPSATSYGSSQNEGQVEHKRPSRGTPSLETIARDWPLCLSGRRRERTSSGGALSKAPNPRFWEWLMGLPLGWTDPGSPLAAMRSCRWLSRMRSELSRLDYSEIRIPSNAAA